MITCVKKIKDVGVFKHYEPRMTGVCKDFEKRNLIYGANTYGKTTLCDILKDVADDSYVRVEKRLTIPDGENQEIIINMSDGQGVIKLDNNKWNNNKLHNKIMVFDTEFMINNVFDGTSIIENRATKENFTEFILGDKGVSLAKEIEELKREVKEERVELSKFAPHSKRNNTEAEIKKYAKLSINESLESLKNEEKILLKQLEYNNSIEKNRNNIILLKCINKPKCDKLEKMIIDMNNVKDILHMHYSLPQNILVTFEQHIKDILHNEKGARAWINQGIHFMGNGEVCPFCGQDIKENEIINAFSECLKTEYVSFKNELLNRINAVNLNWDILSLSSDIILLQKEMEKLEEYFEENLVAEKEQLDSLYQEIYINEKEFNEEISIFRKKVDSLLNSKAALCNVDIEIDITIFDTIKGYYGEKLSCIYNIVDKINKHLEEMRSELINKSMTDKNNGLNEKLKDVKNKIMRLEEDDDCKVWLNKFSVIDNKNKLIKEKSEQLECDQKGYLDTYFSSIDNLFRQYGGHKFKIERGDFSNKGFKKIFGINISFNDVLISDTGLTSSIFSESDKRALALAIFMSKLQCMSEDEKKDIILVFDDPVTSFDDDRMKTVILDLVKISNEINQIFIMTHHSKFARKISDEYLDKFNFYKIKRINSYKNGIYEINPKEEFLEGFDEAFMNIVKFNNAESDKMSDNELRIFMEEYLRVVFAKQYKEYNLDRKKLHDRIDELANRNLISEQVKEQLHIYRNEFNNGSHAFQTSTLEDDRNFSINFVDYLFNNVYLGEKN